MEAIIARLIVLGIVAASGVLTLRCGARYNPFLVFMFFLVVIGVLVILGLYGFLKLTGARF